MQECVMTSKLVLHRHIFEDGTLFSCLKNKIKKSSPQALSALIKKNRSIMTGIFGWWSDISSPYSAAFHIKEDDRLWKKDRQIQYYVYEKETQACIGIFCALIDQDNKAYILAWLSKEGQGKGYSCEVVKELDKLLFIDFGIDEVQYKCYKHNKSKHRVSALLKSADYNNPKEDAVSFTWKKTRADYLKDPFLTDQKIVILNTKPNRSFFSKLKSFFVRQKS